MLAWAREAGIEVPEARLLPVREIHGLPHEVTASADMALAVRRFDRSDLGRIHIEDLAQVRNLWPRDKYRETNDETLARILFSLTGATGVDELVRRLVAMIAMGNDDAHLKNWSLIYRDRRTASLAPAYDLLCTVLYIPGDSMALNLGGTKAFDAVDVQSFARMAERVGDDPQRLRGVVGEAVERLRTGWARVRTRDSVEPDLRDALDRRLRSVPLLAGG